MGAQPTIRLRETQIDALSEVPRLAILERVWRLVEDDWLAENEGASRQLGYERVMAGIERARGYGIETPYGWGRFAQLMVMLGDEFDLDLPWAKEILAIPRLHEEHRLDLVEERGLQDTEDLEGSQE